MYKDKKIILSVTEPSKDVLWLRPDGEGNHVLYSFTVTGWTPVCGGSGASNNFVTTDSLPEQGQQGVIYYNTTDNKYYTYNGDTYSTLSSSINEIYHPEGVHMDDGTFISGTKYIIKEDVYNDLGTLGAGSTVGDTTVILAFDESDTVSSYVGRFTVDSSSTGVTVVLLGGIHIPDDSDFSTGGVFEAGHTYEFNILYDTCVFMDITWTNPNP
jgi:hypothetical protein